MNGVARKATGGNEEEKKSDVNKFSKVFTVCKTEEN